jgi:hypothetical protein
MHASFSNLPKLQLNVLNCLAIAFMLGKSTEDYIEIIRDEERIKSCYFHMKKNIFDYAKNKCGLTQALQNSIFTEWLDGLLGKFFIVGSVNTCI